VQITVELPNDLTQRPNPAREALEALAIAGFRAGTLTAFQASHLLGFGSRFDFERFLKERGIDDHSYSVADLDDDWETLRKLEASREERR
jgi:predicted HTH domain antitoxin